MPLKSGLAVWAYNPLTGATREYGGLLEGFKASSVAPGGCASLVATLKTADIRVPRYELTAFARLAVVAPGVYPTTCLWTGEISDPELGLSEADGEYVKLSALGMGNALRDDPRDDSYTLQTVQQIAIAQMTAGTPARSNTLPLDADQTALFPDNPATQFSPVYTGSSFEDVLTDLCTLAGDYTWGVWPHPVNRDSLGFPTSQVQAHVRDTSTISYTALETAGDISEWHVVPSTQRAFNVIEIRYQDPTQTPAVQTATATDSRLAANGSQGTAPFRRRVFFRDLSSISTVTASSAQAIANAYLELFKNITNKIEIKLKRLRDANGHEIELWRGLRAADSNIAITTLATRGAQLPTTPTAGVNLFYIVQAEYEENGDDQLLTLTCDNFVDTVALQVARMQQFADSMQRTLPTTAGTVQKKGAPVNGTGGFVQQAGAAAQTVGAWINYPVQNTTNTPTQITLGSVLENINTSGAAGVSNISTNGFMLFINSAAAGKVGYAVKYTTVGNCLLAVDARAGTFAHHCDFCEQRARVRHGCNPLHACALCHAAAVARDVSVPTALQRGRLRLELPVAGTLTDPNNRPGQIALAHHCLECRDADPRMSASEHYCTSLTAADEADSDPRRAEQARLIRALQATLGIPTVEAYAAGARVAPVYPQPA